MAPVWEACRGNAGCGLKLLRAAPGKFMSEVMVRAGNTADRMVVDRDAIRPAGDAGGPNRFGHVLGMEAGAL